MGSQIVPWFVLHLSYIVISIELNRNSINRDYKNNNKFWLYITFFHLIIRDVTLCGEMCMYVVRGRLYISDTYIFHYRTYGRTVCCLQFCSS